MGEYGTLNSSFQQLKNRKSSVSLGFKVLENIGGAVIEDNVDFGLRNKNASTVNREPTVFHVLGSH